MRWTLALAALALCTALGAGCAPDADPPPPAADAASTSGAGSNAPLLVYTVNYPLLYFAERIGGRQVQAELPIPEDIDPASWWPSAEAVGAYQQADLVLLNGAGYAAWVPHTSLRSSRMRLTGATFEEDWIPLDESVTHGHGPEGEHSHGGFASTTWLDPRLALAHARAVAAAFANARPEHADAFRERFEALEADLQRLDLRLAVATHSLGGAPVLFSHQVYQYLERRYGLDGRSLHWEPDAHPDDAGWASLEAMLAEQPAPVMIWEADPLPETVSRLAALGVRVVVFEPAANRPSEGDWLEVMQANARRLAESARSSRSKGSPQSGGR